MPACRRLLFPLLHACNKGNRRRVHAGKQLIASSIMSRISDNNLSNPHQWAYKKDHCTEHMTEDWKRALDNNMVVGIVFVDQLLILFLIMYCFKSCKLIVITSPLLMAVVLARVKLRLVSLKELSSDPSYFLSSVMICQTLSVTVMVNCICKLTIPPCNQLT